MSNDEELEPIDVHSLNVASGEESFTVIAKFYDAGEMDPLPYPDPFADRDEADEDWEIEVHSLNVAKGSNWATKTILGWTCTPSTSCRRNGNLRLRPKSSILVGASRHLTRIVKMSANDNIDIGELISTNDTGSLVNVEMPAKSAADSADGDDGSWMDVHTLNFVPPKNVRPIQVTVRHLGRGKPLPHPGIWDDDE